MESFYGGRQGISFKIVKTFDVIGKLATDDTRYKKVQYAYLGSNGDAIYYLGKQQTVGGAYLPVIKQHENYTKYQWIDVPLKGQTINLYSSIEAQSVGTYTLDTEKKTSMVECFERGAASINEVNYGEYVMINSQDKEDPDNGKIFIRGMKYGYDETTNPYAGGELIGQITGPTGKAVNMSVVSYNELEKYAPSAANNNYSPNYSQYSVINGSNQVEIVDGWYVDSQNTDKYNDDIKIISYNVTDDYGNVIEYRTGFRFVAPRTKITGKIASPYTYMENGVFKTDSELADRDQNVYKAHPFADKYVLNIPHGIHGYDMKNFKMSYKTVKAGSVCYKNKELTGGDTKTYSEAKDFNYSSEDAPVEYEYITNGVTKKVIKFKDGSNTYYTSLGNVQNPFYRYEEVSYETTADGFSTIKKVNDYQYFDRVYIDKDTGDIYYYYNTNSANISQDIGTLSTIPQADFIQRKAYGMLKDFDIQSNGQMTWTDNISGTPHNIGSPINYVTGVRVSNGKLQMQFTNPSIDGADAQGWVDIGTISAVFGGTINSMTSCPNDDKVYFCQADSKAYVNGTSIGSIADLMSGMSLSTETIKLPF